MFKRFRENRAILKEIDQEALYKEAVQWTKLHFKKRGVPTWTHEYQYTFAAHVTAYVVNYRRSYLKIRRKALK